MNGPVQEVRRLRQELAELRGLVNQHLELETEAEQRCLEREQAAFEQGHREGDEFGYRRGVEHALVEVENAHLAGVAHDGHGQMRTLGLQGGPVPEPATPEQRVAEAEKYERLRSAWWEQEFERTHQRQAEVDDRELEAG
jgi:hypothetical protein